MQVRSAGVGSFGKQEGVLCSGVPAGAAAAGEGGWRTQDQEMVMIACQGQAEIQELPRDVDDESW